jgi:hypothetical protein
VEEESEGNSIKNCEKESIGLNSQIGETQRQESKDINSSISSIANKLELPQERRITTQIVH